MLAQGYEADNPNIELLRLRNFTAGTRLKEDEVLSPNFLHRTLEIIGALKPLVSAKSPSLPLPGQVTAISTPPSFPLPCALA